MKKIILGLFACSIALPVIADRHFSASLSLGSSDQTLDMGAPGNSNVEDLDMSDKAFSFGIRGAYIFNDYFAVEAEYMNYGYVEKTYDAFSLGIFGITEHVELKHKLTSSAFNVGVRGSYPIFKKLSVNGRMGGAFWSMKQENGVSGGVDFGGITIGGGFGATSTDTDDGLSLYYGVGLQFDITEGLFMGIEYSTTEMDGKLYDIDTTNDISNHSLYMGYQF